MTVQLSKYDKQGMEWSGGRVAADPRQAIKRIRPAG